MKKSTVVKCFLFEDLSSAFCPITISIFNVGPLGNGLTIDSLEVLAAKSSNVNLSCWTDSDPVRSLCSGKWYLNGNQVKSESEKYEIAEKKSRSKCKIEFILSIFNVTENDGGTYSCHWLCEYENATKAAIDLKVFDDLPTGKSL